MWSPICIYVYIDYIIIIYIYVIYVCMCVYTHIKIYIMYDVIWGFMGIIQSSLPSILLHSLDVHRNGSAEIQAQGSRQETHFLPAVPNPPPPKKGSNFWPMPPLEYCVKEIGMPKKIVTSGYKWFLLAWRGEGGLAFVVLLGSSKVKDKPPSSSTVSCAQAAHFTRFIIPH